jgi:hypothetical protein
VVVCAAPAAAPAVDVVAAGAVEPVTDVAWGVEELMLAALCVVASKMTTIINLIWVWPNPKKVPRLALKIILFYFYI